MFDFYQKNRGLMRPGLYSVLFLSFAGLARSDSAGPLVRCVAFDSFPSPQCSSNTPKIDIRSNLGKGEDAQYPAADSIVVNAKGPNDGGDMDKITVVSQEKLPGDGRDTVTRKNGTVVIEPSVKAMAGLKQKDAVILVQSTSGVSTVDVDASAGASGQSAGSVVVVADKLTSLSLKTNGYDGIAGEDPKVDLARKALTGNPAVHPGVAAAYKTRRELDQNLAVPFDDSDLNNYKASGLTCRADETAVGGPGTFAYDSSTNPGSVPTGINVTAFAREETKRAYCQRNPEFAVTQECEAETEYSFQAICKVTPESRSMKIYRRDPVRWERPVCASDTNTQVRRKIIRQAFVSIAIPGIKSYQGLITREISFAQTHNIYRKSTANPALPWVNPFWSQAPSLSNTATIQIKGQTTTGQVNINNGFSSAASYPITGGQNVGAKLTFLPKKVTAEPPFEAAEPQESLFAFKDGDFKTIIVNGNPVGYGQGCAPIVDLASDTRYSTARIGESADGAGSRDLSTLTPEQFKSVVNYYQAFDSKTVGFSNDDLNLAIITVSNCIAYEVMDGIVQGDVVFGDWAMKSGNAEPLSPPPATSSSCQTVVGFQNTVGSETLIQYENEAACYVDDPRDPPSWLKDENCVSRGFLAGCSPRQSDFQVASLSSKIWNRTSGTGAFANSGANGEYKHREFDYPVTAGSPTNSLSEAYSLSVEARKNFCLPVDQNSDYRLVGEASLSQLTRSVPVPVFTMSDGVAVPTGSQKYVCPNGIRLDVYLANVARPTCPSGTSTKMKHSKWSDLFGAANWQTWDEKGPSTMPPEANYSTRNQVGETRYDDLPQQILTAKTHDVDSRVSLGASLSYTGKIFPPVYKDSAGGDLTVDLGGVTARKFPGWTRESSLKNDAGAFISASSFSPFKGVTQKDRSVAWCNAGAFEGVGGGIARGFGAKGLLRDTPKRVFGFKLETWNPTTELMTSETEYVGIEIVGEGASNAALGFYADGIYAGVSSKTADGINAALGKNAFLSKNYPFIGARFRETCQAGELFNEFTGYCHAQGTPWKSSRRVVQRILHDGKTPALWSLALNKANLTDPTTNLDLPFCVPPALCLTRTASEANIDEKILDIYRLGFLRPLRNMADDQAVNRSILMNRPESIGKMVMGPGFASSIEEQSQACSQQFRMIAVPVPSSPSTPVTISTDDYLPEGSVFISADTECTIGEINAKLSIRKLGPAQGVSGGASVLQTEHIVTAGGDVSVVFRNATPKKLFVMKDIKESLNAGMSATTGSETLDIVEIATPVVRSRSGEWTTAREKGGKGWQARVRTAKTDSDTNQNQPARSCEAANLVDGVWTSATDTSPAIANGSSTVDCSLATSNCALNSEEIGLFTKPVSNSKALIVTRPAAVQFSPWSHEIASNAKKDPNYTSSKPLGQWTQIIPGQDGAPVPDCSVYDGVGAEIDTFLPRDNFDTVAKVLDGNLYKIKKPNSATVDFIVLPADDAQRRSDSCIRWDGVNGQTCEVFYPTVGGPENPSFIFGGKWQAIYVETKERLAQTCRDWEPGVGGVLTATCKAGSDPANVPYRQAKGNPRVEFCTPNTCPFQTNSQSFQVEASIAVSGLPGEDGTNSGRATVFCRDCKSVSFSGRPGTGGLGSSPISSQRSKTLTCLSWNNNPLAPIFSVRNLWSQPFVGGAAGPNGRPGTSGGDVSVYSDMTPEAIWMINQEEFWISRKGTP